MPSTSPPSCFFCFCFFARRAGKLVEDERLSLGMFAQDLAQELPQEVRGVDYVTQEVREFDSSITDVTARTIMGSLGLHGEKATRPIGMLSG